MVSTERLSHFEYIFDTALINEIAKVALLKSFQKNDVIIDLEDTLHFIPLLLEGNVKVLREDHNDHEILLYVLEAGDTCAMSLTCCISKSKSKIKAIADTDTTVLMIPIEQMQHWMNTNESWRNFILESYQTRFNEMLETIDTLAFMKMDERLYKYLIDHVKLSASTTLNLTHQEIATDLNTSRVVISRLLKQLENQSKIKLGRHKIEILNYE